MTFEEHGPYAPGGDKLIAAWGEADRRMGNLDKNVSLSIEEGYVGPAKRTGELVNFLIFDGVGHFEISNPLAPSWPILEREFLPLLLTNE